MRTRTPWGTADHSRKVATGIMFYSTPGHGGYHLSKKRNEQVHPALRDAKGWYEEDCEYAIVHFTFPDVFPGKQENAIQVIKNYWPDDYTAATGQAVELEESRCLRERIAREATKDLYVTCAAYGDWHEKVPAGMVGVFAVRGGRDERGCYASKDQKYFLVPADEYKPGGFGEIGFVVDESKHGVMPKRVRCADCNGTGHVEGCESLEPAYDLGDLLCRYPCQGCCPKGHAPQGLQAEQDQAATKLNAILGRRSK